MEHVHFYETPKTGYTIGSLEDDRKVWILGVSHKDGFNPSFLIQIAIVRSGDNECPFWANRGGVRMEIGNS